MTRYLILCAGDSKRWTGRPPLTDEPKHLVELCGEPLLHRTVRLVHELDPDADIRIVVANHQDPRYRVDGTKRVKARLDPRRGGLDKVLSSRHVWHAQGRTVVLLGDVYYTTAAIGAIVGWEGGDWVMFGRPGDSKLTGKPWAEPFALAFWPERHDDIAAAADRAIAAQLEHQGTILAQGLSVWWRSMVGVPDDQLGRPWFPPEDTVRFGHYIAISDATDDIDTPDDWDRWCWGWAHASPADRARLWQ